MTIYVQFLCPVTTDIFRILQSFKIKVQTKCLVAAECEGLLQEGLWLDLFMLHDYFKTRCLVRCLNILYSEKCLAVVVSATIPKFIMLTDISLFISESLPLFHFIC